MGDRLQISHTISVLRYFPMEENTLLSQKNYYKNPPSAIHGRINVGFVIERSNIQNSDKAATAGDGYKMYGKKTQIELSKKER